MRSLSVALLSSKLFRIKDSAGSSSSNNIPTSEANTILEDYLLKTKPRNLTINQLFKILLKPENSTNMVSEILY